MKISVSIQVPIAIIQISLGCSQGKFMQEKNCKGILDAE